MEYPLAINGKEFIATPENASLFSFAGHLSCFNHIFLITSVAGKDLQGFYMFDESPDKKIHRTYKKLAHFMIDNNYPLHMNLQEVAQCDENAFYGTSLQDLNGYEFLPKEWDMDK